MSDTKLAILGILAVVTAGWAVFQHRLSSRAYTSEYSSSSLIEGLAVDAVSAVRITGDEGSKKVDIKKTNGVFAVSDKDNYPADVTKINDLITRSLDVLALEKITSDPANHADLKVTEQTAKAVVEFLDAEGKRIVGYAVSPREEDREFARLLSSDDVYTVQNSPWINATAMGYINTEILSAGQDSVQSVAVQTPEGTYILKTSETGEIELDKLPEGKQLKGTDYQTVFRALSSFHFEDVKSRANVPESLTFNYTYTCKLKDKTVYKVALAKESEKTYAKISADYLDRSQIEIRKDDSEEVLKEKEAKLMAIDAVKQFNQKHEGWVYVIPSNQAGNLTKQLSELLEDIPEPETPEISGQNEPQASLTTEREIGLNGCFAGGITA